MGSDTTSDAPIVFKQKFAHRLVEVAERQAHGPAVRRLQGFSPVELAPQPPTSASRARACPWASTPS